jgi:protein-L-isoaspartate O-methyltransferase
MSDIWGSSDFAYVCLRDAVRTIAFKNAIMRTVERNDVVLEVGAGTGILSLFAAAAGARKVFAVEIDDYLCSCLKETVRANGLEGVVEILAGDAREIELPASVDVVIAELIDTGLVEEPQVPVLNSLIERGVATATTRFVPEAYRTEVQLMWMDERLYGHVIRAPRHEWPFLARPDDGWVKSESVERSRRSTVWSGRFAAGPHQPEVRRELVLPVSPNGPVNALKLCGRVVLARDIELGATNVLNGDKLLSLGTEFNASAVALSISYGMGQGLGSFLAQVEEA